MYCRTFLFIILVFLLSSCDKSRATDLSQGLPLPAVPEELRSPDERASFILTHFWDAMDFKNRKYALDDIFMEQAFSNYASVLNLPIVPDSLAKASVSQLVKDSNIDSDARKKLCSIAYTYLYTSDSPVYNEDNYLHFVEAQLELPNLDEATRARLDYDFKTLNLNRPGTEPADFEFIDHQNNTSSLLPLLKEKTTLLIFYDPDCGDCHKAMDIIAEEPQIQQLIDNGILQVVAISDYDTRDRWESIGAHLPSQWIDGCDVTGIQDAELYEIRFTPTFFIIGSDGKVKKKNAKLGEVLNMLLETKIQQ